MKPANALLAACVACTPVSESDLSPIVSPADGQTDVGAFQPVLLDGYAVDYPENQPLPAFVTVEYLATGAQVEGELAKTETGVSFTPAQPWEADAGYLLTVVEPFEEARTPTNRFPLDDDGLPYAGSSTFSTHSEARPLALITSGDRFCVVASQPLLAVDLDALTIERSGVRIAPTSAEVLEPDAFEPEPLSSDDRGLGVVCGPGDAVQRAWIGEHAVRTSGERSLVETVRDLRRFR